MYASEPTPEKSKPEINPEDVTPPPMRLLNRLPTVEEALAANQSPLCESYWWFRGWNFNRPLIASIHVGGHVKNGPFVWMAVGSDCPNFGFREADMQGISFEMVGPIPLAEQFLEAKNHAS